MTRYAKAPTSGRNPHLGRTALFALLLLFGAMAFSASSALALQTRLPTGTSFGPDGSAGTANFESLQAVTVDQSSGNVYALDSGEGGRLYKFDSTGAPANFSSLTANFIEGVGGSNGAENEIAIAPPGAPGGTAGDIYVANNSVVKIYSPAGAFLGEITGDEEVGHEACGVATDPAGHVFVGFFPKTVREYTPAASPAANADQSGQSVATLPGICNVAADGLGNVYASHFFGSATAKLAGLTDPSPALIEPGGATLAIDPATNQLYLDRGSNVAFYSPAGALEGQFGAANLAESRSRGVAIGSGKVYVNNGSTGKVDVYGPTVTLPDVTTEAADALTKDSATLHGTIDADGGPAASCEFQYITNEAFQANQAKGQGHDGFEGATSVGCTPHGPFTGSGSEAVSAPLTNLSPHTDYRFRVVGSNANGSNPGQTLSFKTFGLSVLSSAVTGATTTAATITGFVSVTPPGKPFTYHVDYGPTATYGSSVPVPDAAGADLPIGTGNFEFGSKKVEGVAMSQGAFGVGQEIVGAGIKPGTTITAVEGSTLKLSEFSTSGGSGVSLTSTTVFVSQPITGLTPGTEYHARLVATNADASFLGPDRSFSTYPLDTGLPDGRAYEMVSPPLKIGEAFAPEPSESLGGSCTGDYCLPGVRNTMMPMQAAPDGEALAFGGLPFSFGLTPSSNQYLSKRSASGWATSSITPPQAPGVSEESGFKAFSPDLSRGVLLQTTPALSPEAPGEGQESFSNLYRWETGDPSLRPLITVEPPNRAPRSTGANAFRLAFAGANSGNAEVPPFEHLVFEANDALTPAAAGIAPAAPEVGEGQCGGFPGDPNFPTSDCDLYEWVDGQLRLVNVLPGNETAATHAVVGSGRRLAEALRSGASPATQAANYDHAISDDGSRIFWSDETGQVYVRIDGDETVEVKDPGQFLVASADGSRVLLTDGCLYSVQAESCEEILSGSPAAFLGVLGADEDLTRIYFVNTEALAAAPEAGSCETSIEKLPVKEEAEGKVPAGLGCNVYLYDQGSVTFITALNERDNNLGLNRSYGDWKASHSNRTAQVSPDGRYLTFMSYARLTGFDNRVVGGGACRGAFGPACFEVFEYDLQTGSLDCASCNPSGLRPLGSANLSLIRAEIGASFPQPANLPGRAEGRLFFGSQDVLSPEDTNGHIQDVYEWTPNGIGDCTRTKGCIALISSGHSPVDSTFLNSTPSGNDVFFVTREQLLLRDKDDLLDVYDARVNGGIAEDIAPPCAGEACKGSSSSPAAAESPGTSTFSGPPNKKPKAHKHKKHRRHKSKKHKSKKHKSKKAHKRSAKHEKTGGSK